jgi:adenine-specific DNA-methyltransferase
MTTSCKPHLGQYFTTNPTLQQTVFEFIHNNPQTILEPSVGRGDLIKYYLDHKPSNTTNFDLYEIDDTITPLTGIDKNKITFSDFLTQPITKKYTTVIGNPPYIKSKKQNIYIAFIEKCYNLLLAGGELIFIIPSDFFKLTSSAKLLNDMLANGNFTHIYHPHDEKLFENASIDVLVFRYCKQIMPNQIVIYNGQTRYIKNNSGMVTFEETQNNANPHTFADYFDIFVGMVSGKEDVFKHEVLGNITVINGQNIADKYIFTDTFPTQNENINAHLLQHKNELIARKIRNFDESNWFEWGAIRNRKVMEENVGKDCIYVNTLSRKEEIAFVGKVGWFGGGLLMLLPQPHQECNLQKVVAFINSNTFRDNFTFAGRFKIGQRQLLHSTVCECLP